MRLHRHVTPASLTLVALAGAAVGFLLAPAGTSPSEPLPGVRFETEVVVVPHDQPVQPEPTGELTAALKPVRGGQVLGQDVVLEAVLENRGTSSVLAKAGGLFDLTVERLGIAGGDVALLALCDAGPAEVVQIVAGGRMTRLIRLATSAPFDRPGRYVVRGTWHRDGATPVAVGPVELIIRPAARALRNAAGA
jgi:hypothetical protein